MRAKMEALAKCKYCGAKTYYPQEVFAIMLSTYRSIDKHSFSVTVCCVDAGQDLADLIEMFVCALGPRGN